MSQVHAVATPTAAVPDAACAHPPTSTVGSAGSEFGRVAFERAFADPARPVSPSVRDRVEAATMTTLGDVRVHTGPRVRAAARGARAAAFTFGRGIGVAVGPGQPIPDALLTHELIHVAQQTRVGGASARDAEAQAHRGARDLGALGPLAATGGPYPAFAAEDWLAGTPNLRGYGFTELIEELRAVNEWLERQIVGSEDSDRMEEVKVMIEAELARRQAAIRAIDRPPPKRRRPRRGKAQPAEPQHELPEQTEMPRVLRERTSERITDPDEIRAEVNRIVAYLQRPEVSKEDRWVLRHTLASLEPDLGAELNRSSAQRRQDRVVRAFSSSGTDPAGVLADLRTIESVSPYQEQPGMDYVIHDGELLVFPHEVTVDVRSRVRTALREAARRTRDLNESTKFLMADHMHRNYEDQYVVGFFVSLVSGEEPVDVQTRMLDPLSDSNMALHRYTSAQERDSLSGMATAVITAADKADQAHVIVLNGIDRSVSAAASIVRGLTITRNLATAVALALGAIVAAPFVAAGVAGTGATGLLATGLTAGGTGLAVGAEGYLIGFAGGAGGELVAGHGGRAALESGLSEGWRVGKQGAAIGVSGGASLGFARNLGLGAEGLSRGAQLWRGAAAGSGGNMIGSATGAAIGDVPEGQSRGEFILRSGAWGLATGAFGGAAGAGSQWLNNPALRYGVGVGLPSAAGAGASYLETGDWSQAVESGALGLTVGGLGMRAPTGVTPAQQWAYQAGRTFMNRTRSYTAGLALGMSDVGPSFRMGESSTETTITMPSGAQGQVAAQPQAPTRQQVPAAVQAPASAVRATTPAPVQAAPNIRVSTGAFIVNAARQVTDPFSGEVLGQRMASAQTARSLITGIRADTAEAAAWRQALDGGEIGLQAPLGSNVPGVDFLTAEVDANGVVTLIVTDVKMSTRGVFPRPATTVPPTWMAELQAAIAPGRLNLGNPALENAIRAAFVAGRVRPRQLNADYSPTGGGNITGF